MKLLGHRTHLKAKAGGESSMFGKAGCSETAWLHAGRGPDGMVKAELPEPQCPLCKEPRPDTAGNIRGSLNTDDLKPSDEEAKSMLSSLTRSGEQGRL